MRSQKPEVKGQKQYESRVAGLGSRVSGLVSRVSGLYAIADSAWNPCGSLAKLAEQFLEGGCRIVQLRMKLQTRDARRETRDQKLDGGGVGLVSRVSCLASQVLDEARAIAALKSQFAFTFIVNDHPEVAMEVGADGVHVGEHDAPVRELRQTFGGRLFIGYSSHSIDEARRAVDDGADYVAFGAIFPTKTKGPDHPVQGVARLRELVSSVSVPVVAIGGINRDNVGQVLDAGASAVAMITALAQAPDVVAETRWFVQAANTRHETRDSRPTARDDG